MGGALDDVPRGTALHQHAAVENRDLVGVFVDQRQIVRDEQHRETHVARQFRDDVEHLALDRHVERGRGLVRNQQLWLVDESGGDHHALAHAAREFVRKRFEDEFGIAKAHAPQQVEDALAPFCALESAMGVDRLHQLPLDRHQRVEAGHRLLEDHRHLGATQRPQHALARMGEVLPAETYRAIDLEHGVGNKTHDRARDHRLARSAFADKGEELARRNREARIVDDLQPPPVVRADEERQALQREHRSGIGLLQARDST